MFWIVTFDAKLTDEDLAARLTEAGGTPPEEMYRVPMGKTEASVEIEADRETAERLRALPGVTGVYPSSEMQPY